MPDADIIVIGMGLSGLVAAAEAADAGRSVIIVDQEPEQNIGAQASWSLGGLFFVDSPEQRRMGIRDSHDLAWQDWCGSARFDREEDLWPRRWAEAYLAFATGEKRAWLHAMGHRVLPIVGWAERGGDSATRHGNSVPRFHLTWGTGPGVVAPFERRVRAHMTTGQILIRGRHKVERIVTTDGVATGIAGAILEPSGMPRGAETSRTRVGEFELSAQAVIVASGGIGGNHDMVRANWPERLGKAPQTMISGVPRHVDGSMIAVVEAVGGRLINSDRMWHYVEGLRNWAPVWEQHGIRILPGPSSMWFSATGERFATPCYPGNDTLGTLKAIGRTGYDYSWFVLNQTIIAKEFALSGSEQNLDFTGKNWKLVLRRIFTAETPGPVDAFQRHGEDFVVADDLPTLVEGMNRLTGDGLIRLDELEREIVARDREMDNRFGKDAQVMLIHNVRASRGDRLSRVAKPHKILDPAHGPLIAVRLNILTRKTLGGFQCDLDGRVFNSGEVIIPGLYAAGEIAGFGGGGMHGYRALEGTFLGGCLFSGRVAGRAAAAAIS